MNSVAGRSRIGVAVSSRRSPNEAVEEIAVALANRLNTGFLLLFVSASYDPDAIAAATKRNFPGIAHAGCSTAGEFACGDLRTPSLVVVALPNPYFSVESMVIPSLAKLDFGAAADELRQLRAGFAADANDLFVMTLLDGLSRKEEVVLSFLQRALDGIRTVGGSSGGAQEMKNSFVIRDGEVWRDAGVVLMARTSLPFRIFKSDHFTPTATKLIVTDCEPETRTVYELDAETAAAVYAEAAGVKVEDLDDHTFVNHLLTVRAGDDYYCRSILRANPDGSLTFYGAVDNGLALTLARPSNMIEGLETRLSGLEDTLGPLDCVIGFDCVQRWQEAAILGVQPRISALFKRFRVVGFRTYGEHYHAMHLNNTFTGVAFGRGERQS